MQQGNQIDLYNTNCTNSNLGISSDGNGQAKIVVSGATVGQVFIVRVKYDPGTTVGTSVPNPTTVHYTWVTKVNGIQVDQDPNGVDLKKK